MDLAHRTLRRSNIRLSSWENFSGYGAIRPSTGNYHVDYSTSGNVRRKWWRHYGSSMYTHYLLSRHGWGWVRPHRTAVSCIAFQWPRQDMLRNNEGMRMQHVTYQDNGGDMHGYGD